MKEKKYNDASYKYGTALKDLVAAIRKTNGNVHITKFIEERHLPKEFVSACVEIGFITRLGNKNGQHTKLHVLLSPANFVTAGDSISRVISKMVRTRKRRFEKKNS